MKLSIVLPTCGVVPDIKRIKKIFPKAQIIVQYDFKKKGKGVTLTKGSKKAKGDKIVWLDGDFEILPEQLPNFVGVDSDIVVASKLHSLSVWKNWSIKRKICTIFYYILVKILFELPISDTQTGLKVFKKKVLKDILPKVKTSGYAFDVEVLVLAHRKGYTITELPVAIEGRSATGSANLINILKMLWDTIKIKLRITRDIMKAIHR